jgi:ribosome biogenesis GTPase A
MAAALKQVQAVIKHCNMVLEVRDARVSTANPNSYVTIYGIAAWSSM